MGQLVDLFFASTALRLIVVLTDENDGALGNPIGQFEMPPHADMLIPTIFVELCR